MSYSVGIDVTQIVGGDSFKIEESLPVDAVDIGFTSLGAEEERTFQSTSKSYILITDQAVTINYFGGAPQTGVTLLLVLAE